MGDITPNFSRSEFGLPLEKAQQYGFPALIYPPEWIPTRLLPLCRALEVLRAKLGGARVTIISGYRPREYDLRRIKAGHTGVSPNSQHHDGKAADFRVAGFSPRQVRDAIMALYRVGAIEIGGLGLYEGEGFCHVDVRGGPLKTWPAEGK